LLPTSFRTKLRRAIALSLARALDRARFLPPVFTFLRSRKLRRKRFRTTKQQLLINSCENLFSEWKSIFSKSILKRNNTFTQSEHPKRVIGVPASALNHSRTLFTMMRTKALSFSGPIATTDKIGSVRKHVFVSIDRFVRLSRFKPLILFLVFLCAENVFRLRSKSSFFAKRSERFIRSVFIRAFLFSLSFSSLTRNLENGKEFLTSEFRFFKEANVSVRYE
jgi:hypothetical protein